MMMMMKMKMQLGCTRRRSQTRWRWRRWWRWSMDDFAIDIGAGCSPGVWPLRAGCSRERRWHWRRACAGCSTLPSAVPPVSAVVRYHAPATSTAKSKIFHIIKKIFEFKNWNKIFFFFKRKKIGVQNWVRQLEQRSGL